jgi:hypothetical protein
MAIIDLSVPIRPHFRWKVAPERVATHAIFFPAGITVIEYPTTSPVRAIAITA